MKSIRLVVPIMLLFLNGYSQGKNFIDKPYLETTSTVDTLVTPDQIYMAILITEKDTKGKISVEELENKMNTKLILLGIDTKKQLTLSDAGSNFKNYFLKKTDVLKNKTYSLLVYDAKTAGEVLAGLESIGVSNVRLTRTKYSKLETLKMDLKQRAVMKAKKQAESMLNPLGQNLGKAIYLSDMISNVSNSRKFEESRFAVRAFGANNIDREDKSIDIDFDKIRVSSAISIKFAIE